MTNKCNVNVIVSVVITPNKSVSSVWTRHAALRGLCVCLERLLLGPYQPSLRPQWSGLTLTLSPETRPETSDIVPITSLIVPITTCKYYCQMSNTVSLLRCIVVKVLVHVCKIDSAVILYVTFLVKRLNKK